MKKGLLQPNPCNCHGNAECNLPDPFRESIFTVQNLLVQIWIQEFNPPTDDNYLQSWKRKTKSKFNPFLYPAHGLLFVQRHGIKTYFKKQYENLVQSTDRQTEMDVWSR
jgi:hypothetical protein